MKVDLPDIESQLAPDALLESQDLIRQLTDYSLTESMPGQLQFISNLPSFHVELRHLPEGRLESRCHCAQFTKTKSCTHAIAGLILARDKWLTKKKSRSTQQDNLMADVLRKLRTGDLKQYIQTYGTSHGSFRADFLARHLHLTRKPDYYPLLLELTPIDKHGQLRLNRNNLKALREITAILVRQAQQLLRDGTLPAAFAILKALIEHLTRLWQKFPAFESQLSTDLRTSLQLFSRFCQMAMAPGLQEEVWRFAIAVTEKENYTVFKNSQPLLQLVENFAHDSRAKSVMMALAEEKQKKDRTNEVLWGCLLLRWMRKWNMKPSKKWTQALTPVFLAECLLASARQQEYEDVLFTLPFINPDVLSTPIAVACLMAGRRAAKTLGDVEWQVNAAAQLCRLTPDPDAWQSLVDLDIRRADQVLRELRDPPRTKTSPEWNEFIAQGYSDLQQLLLLFEHLAETGDPELLAKYDHALLPEYREQLISIYSELLSTLADSYGGPGARQRAKTIYAHLKSIDLFSPVADKIKAMHQRDLVHPLSDKIRGFVFDLDGVIVDTAVHHFNGWRKLMTELGVVIADEDDHHTRGASRMESLDYLLQKYDLHFSQAEKEVLAARKNTYYLESIEQLTPADLLPGSLAFLNATRAAGLKLALGSASKNAKGVLARLGISEKFDAVLDGNDAKASKPDPEIFIKACEALQLPPDEVVVFEDAAKGVQAALAAGCHVIGIGAPGSLPGADRIIPDLAAASPADIIENLL